MLGRALSNGEGTLSVGAHKRVVGEVSWSSLALSAIAWGGGDASPKAKEGDTEPPEGGGCLH